jgi:tetratricopeptide (TPR) repeat protein
MFCGIARAQTSAQARYLCEDIKKPFFSSVGKGVFCARRTGAISEKFSMPKPDGVKRVFVLGESAAGILGSNENILKDKAGGGWLRSIIPGSIFGAGGEHTGLEIINCGMGAYESQRIYEVLAEILKYSPDLLVILSGNNEGLSIVCPDLKFELLRRKQRLLERFYSLKYGRQAAKKKASLKMHGEMLVKMARAAKKARVPVMFCTLPGNIKDIPPFSQLFPETSGEAASVYTDFYGGNHNAALEKLKRGLEKTPCEPLLNFYMAKTLEKLGRPAEAKSYFLKAAVLDESMSRSGAERNALIREVGRSEGACVADLEKLFNNISPGGLPGFPEFMDNVHWRTKYNKMIWEEIFRAVTACGIKGYEKIRAAELPPEPAREEARQRLGYVVSWLDYKKMNEAALAEVTYIKKIDPAVLKEAAHSPEKLSSLFPDNVWSVEKKTRAKELFPLFLGDLAEIERRSGDYGAAADLCERALALAPDNNYLRFVHAQIAAGPRLSPGRRKELQQNDEKRPGETSALRELLGIIQNTGNNIIEHELPVKGGEPGEVQSVFVPPTAEKRISRDYLENSKKQSDLAVEKMRIGDFKKAKKLLFEALNKNPSNPEALMNLCVILRKEGETEQAVNACHQVSEAIYADVAYRMPGFEILAAEASYENYKLLYELGRKREAAEVLRACVQKAPGAWSGLTEAKEALLYMEKILEYGLENRGYYNLMRSQQPFDRLNVMKRWEPVRSGTVGGFSETGF